jgi:hypothetical protein
MIILPKLPNIWENSNYHIVWKIWISRISRCYSSYIKFTINTEVSLFDIEEQSSIFFLINIQFNYRIPI